MNRAIVVFERNERYTESGKPELDWRLIRQALPSGSSPLAIADKDGFTVHCGQEFLPTAVIEMAEAQSGFKSAATLDGMHEIGFSFVQYP